MVTLGDPDLAGEDDHEAGSDLTDGPERFTGRKGAQIAEPTHPLDFIGRVGAPRPAKRSRLGRVPLNRACRLADYIEDEAGLRKHRDVAAIGLNSGCAHARSAWFAWPLFAPVTGFAGAVGLICRSHSLGAPDRHRFGEVFLGAPRQSCHGSYGQRRGRLRSPVAGASRATARVRPRSDRARVSPTIRPHHYVDAARDDVLGRAAP